MHPAKCFQSTISSSKQLIMDIQILLNPHDQIITTGDIISGRVVLNARRRVTVSTVDVRLKGYIRTSLTPANDTNSETWKPCHANHEVSDASETPASSVLITFTALVPQYLQDTSFACIGSEMLLEHLDKLFCWTAWLSVPIQSMFVLSDGPDSSANPPPTEDARNNDLPKRHSRSGWRSHG